MSTKRKPRNCEKEKEEFTLWLTGMLNQQWHLGEDRLRELVIQAAHMADPKLGSLMRKTLKSHQNY